MATDSTCEVCQGTGLAEIDVPTWNGEHNTRIVACTDCPAGEDQPDDEEPAEEWRPADRECATEVRE